MRVGRGGVGIAVFGKLRRRPQRHQQSSVHVVSRSSVITADARWVGPNFILMFDLSNASTDKGLRGKTDRPVPSGTKQTKKTRPKKVKQPKEEAAIGGKDVSLFLFRALGKILHCKRELFLPLLKNPSLLFGPTLNFFVCLKPTIPARLLVLCSSQNEKFLAPLLNKNPCFSRRKSWIRSRC